MSTPDKMPKKDLNEQEVKDLVIAKSDRVTLIVVTNDTRTKDKFSVFKRIVVDGQESVYVKCTTCNDNEMIKYVTLFGSNNLNNHLKKPTHLNSGTNKKHQPSITQFTFKPVSMADRKHFCDVISLWVAKNNRPFNIVNDDGFRSVIDAVITLVTKTGMIRVDDIIPSKTTVRSHCSELYGKMRTKLMSSMDNIDYVNCTTDHWKDTMSGASYMAICIHYYDQQSNKLVSRIIGSFEVGNKCAATIKKDFMTKLTSLGIESKLRMVVMDSASSMIKAFEAIKWVPCAAHRMPLPQKYAFIDQENKDNPDPFPQVTMLLHNAKLLVKKVKKGDFKFDLATRLKQEVKTRWDSTFDMLQSVSKNYQVLMSEESLRQFMDNIPSGLLQEIVELLEPFQHLRTQLCSDIKVTFNLVSITYLEIKSIMKPTAKDSPAIVTLKKRFLHYLNEKFGLCEHHIIATYITPEYRSVPKEHFPKAKVSDAMTLLRSYLEEVPESDTEETSVSKNIQPEESASPFAKYREKVSEQSSMANELEAYDQLKFSVHDINCNPLEFWFLNRTKFPKMYQTASWLLAAPATNTSSERTFSMLGNMITALRNNLEPDTVNMLSFLSSNSDLFKGE